MKNITVILSGAPEGQNIRELQLEPGSTCGDVLRALGLSNYLLSREGSAQKFADEEELYGVVEDGMKLRATPLASVGVVAGRADDA